MALFSPPKPLLSQGWEVWSGSSWLLHWLFQSILPPHSLINAPPTYTHPALNIAQICLTPKAAGCEPGWMNILCPHKLNHVRDLFDLFLLDYHRAQSFQNSNAVDISSRYHGARHWHIVALNPHHIPTRLIKTQNLKGVKYREEMALTGSHEKGFWPKSPDS